MCDQCNAPEHKDATEEQRKAICEQATKRDALDQVGQLGVMRPKPKKS